MNEGIRRAKLMAQDDLKDLRRIIKEREKRERTCKCGKLLPKPKKHNQAHTCTRCGRLYGCQECVANWDWDEKIKTYIWKHIIT